MYRNCYNKRNRRQVYYTYAVNVVPSESQDQIYSNLWMQDSLR